MTAQSAEPIQQLIKRAQSGDSDAVTTLYERYVDRIYRYVAYRVTAEDAEDVTADVFVVMVADLPKYEDRGVPFEAWLYSIARARVYDYYRIHKHKVDDIDEELPDLSALPEEQVVEQQEFLEVQTALQQLSADEQTLLILRFVERKSHQEITEIIGKSVAALRIMQHRALHKLAKLLEAEGKARHYLRGQKAPEPEDNSV